MKTTALLLIALLLTSQEVSSSARDINGDMNENAINDNSGAG